MRILRLKVHYACVLASGADPPIVFISMRIRIRSAEPMRIHPHPDPGQTLPSQKVFFFFYPDPKCQTNADPSRSGSWSDFAVTKSWSLTWKIYLMWVGNTYVIKHTEEGTKANFKLLKAGNQLNPVYLIIHPNQTYLKVYLIIFLVNFLAPGSGSAFQIQTRIWIHQFVSMRIRIRNTGSSLTWDRARAGWDRASCWGRKPGSRTPAPPGTGSGCCWSGAAARSTETNNSRVEFCFYQGRGSGSATLHQLTAQWMTVPVSMLEKEVQDRTSKHTNQHWRSGNFNKFPCFF